MFCIISLPRCCSTSVHHWLSYSLKLPHHINGEYFTNIDSSLIVPTYEQIKRTDPLPVVKLLNNSREAIELFMNDEQYTTIALLPTDPKSIFLKERIANATQHWWAKTSEERDAARRGFIGKVVIDPKDITSFKWAHYHQLKDAERTDFVFFEKDILEAPNVFLSKLGLHPVTDEQLSAEYVAPTITDYQLLANPQQFEHDWNAYYVTA